MSDSIHGYRIGEVRRITGSLEFLINAGLHWSSYFLVGDDEKHTDEFYLL